MTIENATIVLTGVSSPLGGSILEWSCERKLHVIGIVRGKETVVSSLEHDIVTILECDLGSSAAVSHSCEQVLAATGRVDLLVNNASSWHEGGLLTQDPEEVRAHGEVSIGGTLELTRCLTCSPGPYH